MSFCLCTVSLATPYSRRQMKGEKRKVDVILEAHLNAAERRRRDNRREANRILWAAHYWRMATSHARISKQYLEKAVQLEEEESTNGSA